MRARFWLFAVSPLVLYAAYHLQAVEPGPTVVPPAQAKNVYTASWASDGLIVRERKGYKIVQLHATISGPARDMDRLVGTAIVRDRDSELMRFPVDSRSYGNHKLHGGADAMFSVPFDPNSGTQRRMLASPTVRVDFDFERAEFCDGTVEIAER